MQLNLKYEIKNRIIIISFDGELNFMNHGELTDLLESTNENFDAYIFDLTNVTYVDSSAINAIFRYTKKKKTCIVRSKFWMVETVFRVLHLEKLIKFYDTAAEALIEFNGDKK